MCKKILNILAYIALVIVIIQGAVMGYGYFSTKPSRDVGDSFINALHSNDPSGAYALFDAALKSKITEEQFAVLNDQVELKQFSKVDWKSWEISDNKSRIAGIVHSEKGFSTDVILELVKHEAFDAPQIFSFEFKPGSAPNAAPTQAPAPAPQAAPATKE